MEKTFKIPIIFQDEHLIVVDKPVNLPVHKNDFMPHDAHYLTKLLGELTGKWIYNVHRLDSKTSGVMVLAFSKEAAHELTLQFERKEVVKKYVAVVEENPGEGSFDRKVLVKKKSKFKKPALTHFKTLETLETGISFSEKENINISFVEITPATGRWHQIRQHFAQNHNDIIGDTHHGDFTLNKIITEKTGVKRLLLHASQLNFFHPETKENMSFNAPVPQDFASIFDFYRKEAL